jgi:glucose uptake protein
MFIVSTLPVAVLFCLVTMLCWGSWGNTRKLCTPGWAYQLFYWDYALGVLLFSVALALTLGSHGPGGRPFLADVHQALPVALGLALLGGVLFNLSNILLVAAMDITGMAVAFPVGVGLALVIGVVTSYLAKPVGSPALIGTGVLLVSLAILLDGVAYGRLLKGRGRAPRRGILLSVAAGILMGFFYRFVVAAMVPDFTAPAAGRLTPYTALVFFSLGVFLSNFLWNSLVMRWPIAGERVGYGAYVRGGLRDHAVGVLGGVIWSLGMSFSILASGVAGPAVSYGLGQGATLVAAFWGVFVWKEFKGAPRGTTPLLALMFLGYLIGLALLVVAR